MKKVIFFIAIAILVTIISNFAVSIYQLWQKKDLITRAQDQLNREKMRNVKLKGQLQHVRSQYFIEEQARDKLFLVKPGENTIVIPSSLLQASPSGTVVKKEEKPNWLLWRELFFQ